MPRRKVIDDGDLESEVDRTFAAIGMDLPKKKRGPRLSAALRSQKDEEEERQKILMEMNASSGKKAQVPQDSEKMLEIMRTAISRTKQLAALAFHEDIIDNLPTAVEREPLYKAGNMLDVSAQIYATRVDVAHLEACDVRCKLGDQRKGDDGMKAAEDDNGNDIGSDDESRKNKGAKGKKGHAKENADSDSEVDDADETLKKDILNLVDAPTFVTFSLADNKEIQDEKLDARTILKKFATHGSRVHEECMKRRSKVSMTVFDANDLNDSETGLQFCSHLYSKATHNFDEGSSSGLLMQNAVTSKSGRRYMLHNNCRCGYGIRDERLDGEDLHAVWKGIEETERFEPNVHDSVNNYDEAMSLPSENTRDRCTESVLVNEDGETSASTSCSHPLQKNVVAFLEDIVDQLGRKSYFKWRKRLQKKYGLSTAQFVTLLTHAFRDQKRFSCRTLVQRMLVPAGVSYINRIADPRSGLTYAPISDELEPFEISLGWRVWRKSWSDLREAQYRIPQITSNEHPLYNYFFARSQEEIATDEAGSISKLPVFRCVGEVIRDLNEVTGDDQEMLAHVLETVRVGKGDSLFKRKGEDFGRRIAQIPIATPIKKPSTELEGSSLSTRDGTITASETFISRSDARMDTTSVKSSRLGDAASLDGMDSSMYNDDFDAGGDLDADIGSVTSDAQLLGAVDANKQLPPISERSESSRAGSVMRSEKSDAASVYSDVHLFNDKRVAITAYSIVNDETHWKKRKLDCMSETSSVSKEKVPTKPEKTERKKTKREEKGIFEQTGLDSLPLTVVRDRQKQAKRTMCMVKSYDEIRKPAHTCIAVDMLYNPKSFYLFTDLFKGEWTNIWLQPSDSESSDHLSKVLKTMICDESNPESMVQEHLSLFNGYFDDSPAKQQPIPSSSPGMASPGSTTITDSEAIVPVGNDIEHTRTSTPEPAYSMQDDESELNETVVRIYRPIPLDPSQTVYTEIGSQTGDAEVFGVKCDIRQRRINAPAVKRAIATILSNIELDADALNAKLAAARASGDVRYNDLKDLNILGDDRVLSLNAFGRHSDLSTAEEKLQLREEEEMQEDPTCDMRHVNEKINKFHLRGRHTFSSVLAQLPSFLAGRTADDINPVNAFSVLLHLCNENDLELLQRHDENGMVLEGDMGDFTILPMQLKKKNRKRAAPES